MAKSGTAYTMKDLNNYVRSGEQRNYAEGVVAFDITHNYIKRNFVEIPFETAWTISRCKDKIYSMMGTLPDSCKLTLNGIDLEDGRTLGEYYPKTGMVMHVTDLDPHSQAKNGGYDDVSKVKKYVMSDEDYAKRDNTYLAYKKKMLAKDPNWKPVNAVSGDVVKKRMGLTTDEELELESLEVANERMKVGDRCEILGGRRGEVKYIGFVPQIAAPSETPIVWVGVCLDEATGKNDGSIKGKRYFQAGHNCGAFMKSPLVKVGDYPEKDPFDDSDDDLMDEL